VCLGDKSVASVLINNSESRAQLLAYLLNISMSSSTYASNSGKRSQKKPGKIWGSCLSREPAISAGQAGAQSTIKVIRPYGLTDDEYLRASAREQTQTSCWNLRTQYKLP
jgi:hypothetical protein